MNRARQFFWQALQRTGLVKRRKHHFLSAVEAYLQRWKKFPGVPRRESVSGGVGVLLTPWLQTAVPLYSVECARQLAKSGETVTLIWDSTNLFDNAANVWEISLLLSVIATARTEFEVIEPPVQAPSWEKQPAFFDELLTENAVQACRGERGAEAWLAARPEARALLRAHVERVAELLRRRRFDWLLIPGGIWAVSGVYAAVAAEQGISITTFDSGEGALYVAHDGAAAHFTDVAPVANSLLKAASDEDAIPPLIESTALEKLAVRMRGEDEYRLQPVAASAVAAGPVWDIIVPLNLRWDSAALCRQRLFASVGDWLSQLLAWVESHPTATIAIRQHPCEKLVDFRGTDDFRELVAQFPRLGARATYISAQDSVNTYDLISGAKVILPFTSRVGIEATILGKPVVLGTKCYYDACGFTWNPASGAEYFATIAEALGGWLVVSDQARRNALITYYLAECCLELKTHFTPAPPDFACWVKIRPEEFWAEEGNQDLLTAMTARQPLIGVRYRRLTRLAKEASLKDRNPRLSFS